MSDIVVPVVRWNGRRLGWLSTTGNLEKGRCPVGLPHTLQLTHDPGAGSPGRVSGHTPSCEVTRPRRPVREPLLDEPPLLRTSAEGFVMVYREDPVRPGTGFSDGESGFLSPSSFDGDLTTKDLLVPPVRGGTFDTPIRLCCRRPSPTVSRKIRKL